MVSRALSAAVLAFGFSCALPLAAVAGPYTAEYVFGDSLSDNGNLAEVAYHQNFPNPPSFHDSFTNGPVSVSVLASSLGLTLTPSLWVTGFQDPSNLFGGSAFVPGTNYAVAAATAAQSPIGGIPGINLPQQVAAFSAAKMLQADPNALYVVMIGGNDVRNAVLHSTGVAAVTAGVQAELAAVQTLSGEGARNILVVNVPNVGVIPEFTEDPTLPAGSAAAATQLSQLYNQQLAAGLGSLTLPANTDLTQFDLYNYNTGILAKAGSYGLTNTTDPCFLNTPLSPAVAACAPGASNIGSFVYWDAIHPTQQVHALWAQGFEAALGEPVPEPTSALLLGTGVLGLSLLLRRNSAARAV